MIARAKPRPSHGTALIVDECPRTAERTSRAFLEVGWRCVTAADLATARLSLHREVYSLLVTELRFNGRWAFELLDEVKRLNPDCEVWILTAYPSVGTAVRAARLGFHTYLTKPLDARELPTLLDSGTAIEPRKPAATCGHDPVAWPSLDRTIWELINQVLVSSDSLSDAARRLQLDRRSLRRMLAKFPPAL